MFVIQKKKNVILIFLEIISVVLKKNYHFYIFFIEIKLFSKNTLIRLLDLIVYYYIMNIMYRIITLIKKLKLMI